MENFLSQPAVWTPQRSSQDTVASTSIRYQQWTESRRIVSFRTGLAHSHRRASLQKRARARARRRSRLHTTGHLPGRRLHPSPAHHRRILPQTVLPEPDCRKNLLQTSKGDHGRYDGVSNSVLITWQVTFAQLQKESATATNLLALMSQFQPQNIPERMLHGYSRVHQLTGQGQGDDSSAPDDAESKAIHREDDLDMLYGHSLVSPVAAGLYQMHSLVQFCTRAWVATLGEQHRWSSLFLQLAAEHFPLTNPETESDCQQLLPHVENLAAHEVATAPDLSNQRQRVLQNKNPNLPAYTSFLAAAHHQQDRFKEGGKLMVEEIMLYTGTYGAHHPLTLSTKSSLPMSYLVQGQLEDAKWLAMEVLQDCRAKLGAEHPETLASMGRLALVYLYLFRLEETESLGNEVLQVYRAEHGLNHSYTLSIIDQVALTCWKQDQLEDAEELQVPVIQGFQAMFGFDHCDTLSSMCHLACT
ncbi:uncharacterized protein F5Z01DRAFT_693664 [Emericellopsis atlantica]|uniref:Kinesin light chain n=1 Tax=Emericellopsis atlantica TaxID=2614577 RepID=A0A9P8CL69_9HYPO|nr:uncharacterized protein F5Z01DRAFT_693664 [Emericellopsis atlantica]KAG9250695.1 hypothetical protein F5Z01DRAFT_693664 [Emericellopsis atlantica]